MMWQKKWVERLVTRLPAREAVKDRLREELWGHLVSLYEEERARHPIDNDARRAACRRLGESIAIEREFRSCRSVHERLEERLLRLIAPVRVADIRTYAVNKAVRIFIVSGLALFAVSCFAVDLPGMTPIAALTTWITGTALQALAAVSTGVIIYEFNAGRAASLVDVKGTVRLLCVDAAFSHRCGGDPFRGVLRLVHRIRGILCRVPTDRSIGDDPRL